MTKVKNIFSPQLISTFCTFYGSNIANREIDRKKVLPRKKKCTKAITEPEMATTTIFSHKTS